ncbi:MAG: hypothetical protein JWM59_2117 [Verrucomicrobiales bacterium]|nr:hypothetical protein [Verrucomicrobiales bacterium]
MSLRLFLSADLAGSTAFKQNCSANEWQNFFGEFYRQLPAYVDPKFGPNESRLSLWKTIGDEIVFSAGLATSGDAPRMVDAFRKGVAAYRRDIITPTRGLDLKCAGWTAGFPVGNLEVELPGLGGQFDYIGPGMDIGFRLVKEATPRRMLLCVELAYILSLPAFPDPGIMVGTHLQLKGVAKGRQYPCLWLDCFPSGECTGWDKIELDEEELQGARRTPANQKALHSFCHAWLQNIGTPFHVPFIEGDGHIGTPPEGYAHMMAEVISTTQGPEGMHLEEEPLGGDSDEGSLPEDFIPKLREPDALSR